MVVALNMDKNGWQSLGLKMSAATLHRRSEVDKKHVLCVFLFIHPKMWVHLPASLGVLRAQ